MLSKANFSNFATEMKLLTLFLTNLMMLFSLSVSGNLAYGDAAVKGSSPTHHANAHAGKTHHHKVTKISGLDFTNEDTSDSVSSLQPALVAVVLFFPAVIWFLFCKRDNGFAWSSSPYPPHIRRFLLLRSIRI